MTLEIEQEIGEAPVITEVKTLTLYEKLHEVALAIGNIEKNGKNTFANYDYVTEADVKRTLRKELLSRRIIVIPRVTPGSVNHLPATGGKGFVTTVEIIYQFIDLEAQELTAQQFQTNAQGPVSEISVPWTGAGSDIGGDKGLYKAFSGALKYLLLTMFLIPTGDDPEGESTSTGDAQGEVAQAHPDDSRPTVPSVPLDRARAVLELAVTAGLAEISGEGATFKVELKPVLKAKLATVGVTSGKIGDLTVDTVEDVETWLKTEATNV